MSKLTLKRKVGESVLVGEDVVITVMDYDRGAVSLRFDAPAEVIIDREEVRIRKDLELENGPLDD